MSPQLLTIPEACALLSISPKTGWNWLTQSKFPVPTAMLHGHRVARLSDVVFYVDGLFAGAVAANQSICSDSDKAKATITQIAAQYPPKRGRGRPRQTQLIAVVASKP
jgi:hypothetical protein